jgi:hypothetical protein
MVDWFQDPGKRWGLLPLDEPSPKYVPSLPEPSHPTPLSSSQGTRIASRTLGEGSGSQSDGSSAEQPEAVLPPDPAASGTPS